MYHSHRLPLIGLLALGAGGLFVGRVAADGREGVAASQPGVALSTPVQKMIRESQEQVSLHRSTVLAEWRGYRVDADLSRLPVLREGDLSAQDIQQARGFIEANPDVKSYHLLFALRRKAPDVYKAIPAVVRAKILCDVLGRPGLARDFDRNPETTQALRDAAPASIPLLVGLLEVVDFAYEPSGIVTGVLKEPFDRVCDYAYQNLARATGHKPILPLDIPGREREIETLMATLRASMPASALTPPARAGDSEPLTGALRGMAREGQGWVPLHKSSYLGTAAIHPADLGPADVQRARRFVEANPNLVSYHLLMAIRRKDPEAYKVIPDRVKVRILSHPFLDRALAGDLAEGNAPGARPCDSEVSQAVVATGPDIIPWLVILLDITDEVFPPAAPGPSTRPAPLYRVCDYAYYNLARVLGEMPNDHADAGARDREIQRIKEVLHRRRIATSPATSRPSDRPARGK